MNYVHAKATNLWRLPEHALAYLEQAHSIPQANSPRSAKEPRPEGRSLYVWMSFCSRDRASTFLQPWPCSRRGQRSDGVTKDRIFQRRCLQTKGITSGPAVGDAA